MTEWSPSKIRALAEEIERRHLKFADVVNGAYEMPSAEEHELICAALRKVSEPTPHSPYYKEAKQ